MCRKILFFLFSGCFLFHTVSAQNTQQTFGRSRIQNKVFEWKVLTTSNFEIFYYQGETEIANYAARYIESDFERMTDLLGYTPYAKVKVFLYNSLDDLAQSNVGLSTPDNFNGGKTNFIKSRVEIPFTGTYIDFQQELRRGIAQTLVQEMMFGGSLKEMLQSAYLLALPDWFMAGVSAYAAEGWSLEMDDYMRDAVLNENFKRPATLVGDEATFIGHGIWNYIAEKYGKSNISNILNLTRIIRNEETSIASTVGMPYGRFLKECRAYYGGMGDLLKTGYSPVTEDFMVRTSHRSQFLYNQVKLSPDGKLLAYSENRKGRYRIYAMDLATRKRRKLMRGGYKRVEQRLNPDLPLLAWRNNANLLAMYTYGGKSYLRVLNANKKLFTFDFFDRKQARRKLENFNQMLDFCVSEDGNMLAISANRKGQTDIFTYNMNGGSLTQITNDFFDDLTPAFLRNGNGALVFSSNRLSDTLANANRGDYRNLRNSFDLFAYNPAKSNRILTRLTEGYGNKSQPVSSGTNTLFYLNDRTGIRQLYRYDLKTGTAVQVSGFLQNIQAYSLRTTDSTLAYLMQRDGSRFVGIKRKYDFTQSLDPILTRRNAILTDKGLIEINEPLVMNPVKTVKDSTVTVKTEPAAVPLAPGEVDTDNYRFDEDSRRQKDNRPAKKSQNTVLTENKNPAAPASSPEATVKGPVPYVSRVSIDNTVTTVQIDPLRGFGVVANVTLNDMLEDHRFTAGGYVSLRSLKSNDVYFDYQYLKRRVDFGGRFERKSIVRGDQNQSYFRRYTLNRAFINVSYPINASSRLVASPFFAQTRYTELGFSSIEKSDLTTRYAGLKLEYVFDNTTFNGLNMIKGTRAKIRYENYRAFGDSGSFNNILIDFRHYQPLHREIILATRLAFGQFGGSAPKSYILGGVDNWVLPIDRVEDPQSSNSPLAERSLDDRPDNRDLLFADFATPLRGFGYGKLIGKSFVLFNAEVRFPVIRYFYRSPITSNFFRNLQLVGFTDIGAAWTGVGPFNQSSELNTNRPFDGINSGNNAFRGTTVVSFNNPFLIGYGTGLRTLLLGFYAKVDVAWGMQNGIVGDTRYYLTLGYDF
jgi:Tol biopolymer transport system component